MMIVLSSYLSLSIVCIDATSPGKLVSLLSMHRNSLIGNCIRIMCTYLLSTSLGEVVIQNVGLWTIVQPVDKSSSTANNSKQIIIFANDSYETMCTIAKASGIVRSHLKIGFLDPWIAFVLDIILF